MPQIRKRPRHETGRTHTARPGRAVDLTSKGVDVDLVRRFLGHASIATTQLYLRGRDRLGEELAVKS